MALKLAPNVPVVMEVLHLDITKGQYGAQARFKGKVAGEVAYLYTDHEDAINGLVAVGALEKAPEYNIDALPEKGLDCSKLLKKRMLAFTSVQGAGDRKGRLTV